MAKTSNQKKKLLLTLRFLKEKSDDQNPVSVQKIISYLESYGISAERKSIYSDIEELTEMGYDVNPIKGKGYFIGLRDFQLPELKLLCDAVAASKFITPKKSDELIEKLKKLTSEEQAKQLKRQVHVVNRIKTMNESVYIAIDSIHTAISEKKKLKFRYFDFDENKQKAYHNNKNFYTVSPLSLLWDDENYYFIAYDEDAGIIKHFRADKMDNINPTEEDADTSVTKDFDLTEYSKKLFGMFGGEETAVWLLCDNNFAGKVIDRFGKDLTFVKVDGEHFKVRIKVIVSPMFFSWVTGMNGKVKIIEPENIKTEFKAHLKKMLDIHE